MRQLWPLLLVLVLVACTGTSSPQPPRFLLVTHGTAGAFTASLVLDDHAATPRFSLLTDADTPLAGEPVASDVVDRAGARSQVVLLLREAAAQYSAAFLDVAGLELAALGPLSQRVLDLTPLLLPVLDDAADMCLTELQVSQDGELLALLNVPAECTPGSLTKPSIFVVSAAGSGSLVGEFAATTDLLPSGLHLEQGTADAPDRLHWLDGVIGAARLAHMNLADQGISYGTSFPAGSGNPAPNDFGFSDGAFIATQGNTVHLLRETTPSARTISGSAGTWQVVADPWADQLQALVLLNPGSGSRLVVWRGATDSTPFDWPVGRNVTAATLHPVQLWVYLAYPGGIGTVDLVSVLDGAEPDGDNRRLHSVSGLGAPSQIVWIEGVLPAPVSP